MISREQIEHLLADVKRRRTEAEAEAGHAAERLARLVSGMTPLDEVDTEQVRATADTYADAVRRLNACAGYARDLRRLLM